MDFIDFITRAEFYPLPEQFTNSFITTIIIFLCTVKYFDFYDIYELINLYIHFNSFINLSLLLVWRPTSMFNKSAALLNLEPIN